LPPLFHRLARSGREGEVVCPKCGAQAGEGARFCPSCGAALAAPASGQPQAGASARAVSVGLLANRRNVVRILGVVAFFSLFVLPQVSCMGAAFNGLNLLDLPRVYGGGPLLILLVLAIGACAVATVVQPDGLNGAPVWAVLGAVLQFVLIVGAATKRSVSPAFGAFLTLLAFVAVLFGERITGVFRKPSPEPPPRSG